MDKPLILKLTDIHIYHKLIQDVVKRVERCYTFSCLAILIERQLKMNEKPKKKMRQYLRLNYQGHSIWVWPLEMDIYRISGDYKDAGVLRGGLIIPRTELRRGGWMAPTYHYFSDIYPAIRSRQHIIDNEKESAEQLIDVRIDAELIAQSLSLWKILSEEERAGLTSQIQKALEKMPQSPRAKEKVLAYEQLFNALDFRDKLRRNNPGVTRARLTSASFHLEKGEDVIRAHIIVVNSLRLLALQRILGRMENILAKILRALRANLISWSGFEKKPNDKQLNGFVTYFQNLKMNLNDIRVRPHLATVDGLKGHFDSAVKAAKKHQMEELKRVLENLAREIEMILNGSLDDKGSQ